jgi:uncharacterized protein (TIGR02453 family)
MLHKSTIRFLRELAAHNDKPWFDAHRDDYQTAKADVEQFVQQLFDALTPLEPALAEQQGKDAVYRIFRDVRFSKDKTPYKNHFGAFFTRGGRKWEGAGYYVHIEPGAAFAGGGLWMPQGPLLKAVRQEIDYSFDEFQGIVKDKTFSRYFKNIEGEELQKAPQGYEPDNPAIGYLKKKSFTVGTKLDDDLLTSKTAIKELVKIYTAMHPFVRFMNRSLE